MFYKQFPPEMSQYFDLRWDNERIWALDLPVISSPVALFRWHIDYPFLPSDPPSRIFDLRPRTIIERPPEYRSRYDKILNVDTKFPIETMAFGQLLVILDGFNRLMNHIVTKKRTIQYRVVPRESFLLIARDKRNQRLHDNESIRSHT